MLSSKDTATGLLSEIIMARLISEAQRDDHNNRMAVTLSRLQFAFHDNVYDRATFNANPASVDNELFRLSRKLLNAVYGCSYLGVMLQLGRIQTWLPLYDWGSPKYSEGIALYLVARRIETRGFELNEFGDYFDGLALIKELLEQKLRFFCS